VPLPHAPARAYLCRGCTLIAVIDGGPHSSTLRSERTPGTPACPYCGTSSWIDPTSFTAFYAKIDDNRHTCIVGRHWDPDTRHFILEPTSPLPEPSRSVLVIARVSAGLCREHLGAVQTAGIGCYSIVTEEEST
jgi:hypothetical protein